MCGGVLPESGDGWYMPNLRKYDGTWIPEHRNDRSGYKGRKKGRCKVVRMQRETKAIIEGELHSLLVGF